MHHCSTINRPRRANWQRFSTSPVWIVFVCLACGSIAQLAHAQQPGQSPSFEPRDAGQRLAATPASQPTSAAAEREAQQQFAREIKRYSHEPSSFGYTFDGNDENFMDIRMSFKYSPIDDGISRRATPDKAHAWKWHIPWVYFAFSMRQAFYIDTERESNPVIGQRFNPEVFGRYWLSDGGYLDIGYNHESNGQSISSAQEYAAKLAELADGGKSAGLADEYISRGWDYWELTWKNNLDTEKYGVDGMATYLVLRRFLSEGFLQDGVEEVNDWETSGHLLRRSEVDGFLFRVKWSDQYNRNKYLRKATYTFTTGVDNLFARNSNRLELGLEFGWPVSLWFSEGYNDDLVDYYRRVFSVGVTLLELEVF